MPSADTLKDTLEWFQKAVPEPSRKNLHTQLGCHLEEVDEMLNALTPSCGETLTKVLLAKVALSDLADHLKASEECIWVAPAQKTEVLDALCDQIVTATGVAHMLGYDIVGAMEEVNASNFSKFVDGQPIFGSNQKIQKGPAYFKASLDKFVD
jgi:predicted HAD superfamily Cof-like phosphohydrolase